MKNNQDIGPARKRKLEDLHDSPDDFVWDAIEEKLKKKRRRLLFWYFTFGLGVMILGLFIFNPLNTLDEDSINDSISIDQTIEVVKHQDHQNTSSSANFKDQKHTSQPVNTLNTKNKLSNDNVSSKANTLVTRKTST